MTERPTLLRSVVAVAVASAVVFGAASAAIASTAVDPLPPQSAHAQVVSTWLIDFDDSPYWWNVVEYGIDLAGTQLVADDPTFLVGSGEQRRRPHR